MATQLQGDWPYHREQPDVVTLGVRPGVDPSTKPPVRIFLGTEEGQYRAERVFVYSVEQVRDPARVYEIHLMKNLAGFDRRGWRTGFTYYRFAIPDFAGGRARRSTTTSTRSTSPTRPCCSTCDMDGHGYLAIAARDTSVMLIDCEKMLPWWNRAAASTHGAKGALTSKPGRGTGPVGRARPALERARPRICRGPHQVPALHGPAPAALEPVPRAYSYHPNPLAYIWHDLERAADAEGFEVFTREAPSPGFAAVLGSNQPRRRRRRPDRSFAARRAACCARPGPAACWSPAWAARRRRRSATPSRDHPARLRPGRGRLPEDGSTRCSPPASSSASPAPTRLGPARAVRRGRPRAGAADPRHAEGARQRRLVAAPARGDRGPLPEGELAARRRAALPTGSLAVEASQIRRDGAAGEPAGLGADRRGRGGGPAGAPDRGGAGLAVRGEAPGHRAARGLPTGCSAPRGGLDRPARPRSTPPWPDLADHQRPARRCRWRAGSASSRAAAPGWSSSAGPAGRSRCST